MKRILFSLLALVLALSMAACGASSMSSKEADKNLQAALGDYKELPMDMEQVTPNLGENVLEQSSEKEDSKDATHIAVGEDVVVYKTVVDNDTKTPSGKPYRFIITVMHFGGAEIKKNNVYNLHFIGANIKVDVEAEDKAGVLQEMKAQLSGLELSSEDAALMTDLVDGKQIYAKNGSTLWDMYAQVKTDVEITYEKESGGFLIKKDYGYDDMFDQYSYDIMDLKGRVKQTVHYKIDESGKTWITENYEYTYLADDIVKVYDTGYYDYTTQIQSQNVHLRYPQDGYRTLWHKSFRDDGTLEYESYYDENGDRVSMEYFADGSLFRKRITTGVQYDSDYGEDIYEEEYDAPGILGRRSSLDGNIFTREEFFFNGKLKSKDVMDMTRTFSNGETYLIESVNGFEDGSRSVFTFYDNRQEKMMKRYNEFDMLEQELLYREDGTRESDTYYHIGKINTVFTYHNNGNLKCRTEYNSDGEIYAVTHYDENGNEIR